VDVSKLNYFKIQRFSLCFQKRYCNDVAEARALYSASVEDLVIECCFLVLYKMGQLPNNMR
jgi:hypothetical protein